MRIPVRQMCACCRKIYKMDFNVPDSVWLMAVPTEFNNSLLCFECFTAHADERFIPWADTIEVLAFYDYVSQRDIQLATV